MDYVSKYVSIFIFLERGWGKMRMPTVAWRHNGTITCAAILQPSGTDDAATLQPHCNSGRALCGCSCSIWPGYTVCNHTAPRCTQITVTIMQRYCAMVAVWLHYAPILQPCHAPTCNHAATNHGCSLVAK